METAANSPTTLPAPVFTRVVGAEDGEGGEVVVVVVGGGEVGGVTEGGTLVLNVTCFAQAVLVAVLSSPFTVKCAVAVIVYVPSLEYWWALPTISLSVSGVLLSPQSTTAFLNVAPFVAEVLKVVILTVRSSELEISSLSQVYAGAGGGGVGLTCILTLMVTQPLTGCSQARCRRFCHTQEAPPRR